VKRFAFAIFRRRRGGAREFFRHRRRRRPARPPEQEAVPWNLAVYGAVARQPAEPRW